MGRWDYGIYDSDTSLDFLWGILQFLMKEAAFVFAPEQVTLNTAWLRDAVTVIEIMNFFAEPYEEHFGLPVFLEDHGGALARWRETFFGVWDGEWDDIPAFAPYSLHAYRTEHQLIAARLFERLSGIADYWRDDLPERDLQPFAYLDNLPVFSRQPRHPLEEDTGQFFYDLVEKLTYHIVFFFSKENREKEEGFDFHEFEKLWVAIDLTGDLCEKYQISPQLKPQTVQRWLDAMIGFWIDYYAQTSKKIYDV